MRAGSALVPSCAVQCLREAAVDDREKQQEQRERQAITSQYVSVTGVERQFFVGPQHAPYAIGLSVSGGLEHLAFLVDEA